jgi:hypothetical protein
LILLVVGGFSLSGFSFGCCCCYFVFGFSPPFIILAIFTSGTNTLLFVLGVLCFLSASWREGHPRSKMNLQTVSTWYECTLYWVFKKIKINLFSFWEI